MKIKAVLGTGGCRHVTLTNLAGDVLDVMTRDDFGSVDDDNDSPLKARVRQVVKRFLAANPGATAAQVKAAVEAEDF